MVLTPLFQSKIPKKKALMWTKLGSIINQRQSPMLYDASSYGIGNTNVAHKSHNL